MKFIELKNVNKTYKNGITAVADMSVEVSKGEFVFVIGLTASGKSTFIKMLYREEKPTKGTVFVGGLNVGKLRNRKVYKLRRKEGIVFQDFKLLPRLTVYENVAFAQRVIETPARYIRRQVPAVLTMVGLADKYKSYPRQLSGGEQQRVAIARAIVNKPDIILADEPTGNLDPKNSWEIMNLLEDINARGTTVVVVTHNKDIVNAMKKRVITIKHGVIVSDQQKGEYIDED